MGKGVDPLPESVGQLVVFQQDAVLQGMVPSLDLALDLRSLHLASYNRAHDHAEIHNHHIAFQNGCRCRRV